MKKLFVSVAILAFVFALAGCGAASKNSLKKEKEIPKIPHKVDSQTSCITCHQEGQNGAKVTSHPERPNCTGCHKSVG